jgi:hypothetical protein
LRRGLELIGLTLLNVRWTLKREGELTLSWASVRLLADRLDAALAARPDPVVDAATTSQDAPTLGDLA